MKDSTMKAARLNEAGADFVVEDVPVPTPAPGQVLIRIAGAGACHSDLHIKTGEQQSVRLPHTLDHENAGCIEALGPGAEGQGFAVGDAVVVFGGWGCGHCPILSRRQGAALQPHSEQQPTPINGKRYLRLASNDYGRDRRIALLARCKSDYYSAVADGLQPDEVFDFLVQRAWDNAGPHDTPQLRAAALAVVAYLFEICEVFERE
jgi:hypothetical protein